MNVSFVLLTWNSDSYIQKCLQSLLDELENFDSENEIFIIDNGSNDKTVVLLKSFQNKYPNLIFPIFLETNTGTTFSRNLALKQARGNYICIMDSDVEIFTGVLEHLISTLNKFDNAGIVAPKLTYPNGKLQKSTDEFPTVLRKFYRYFFLKWMEKRENELSKKESLNALVCDVDYAISAMWMLKKEVVEKVGLLDEKIFYAPEDVDYCIRVWKAGYSVLYDQEVSCIHHTQEISRGFKINKAFFSHIKGLAYYFWKHKYIFTKPKISL